MKALSAGLTFVNFSTVCALLLGLIDGGLGTASACLLSDGWRNCGSGRLFWNL